MEDHLPKQILEEIMVALNMDWWSSTQWIVLQNPTSSATLPPAPLLSLSLGLTAFNSWEAGQRAAVS